MAIFRIKHNDFETGFCALNPDTLETNEWEDTSRLEAQGWDNRYDYEAQLLKGIIEETKVKTVLEIGSGPGILSQKIQAVVPTPLTYHLVDKPYAKKYFEEHKLKGQFFVKDISVDLNTEGLSPSYNLVIINDTLEHLLAPANIVKRIYHLMDENSTLFVSVPNWRMSHQFVYRGLWTMITSFSLCLFMDSKWIRYIHRH